MMKHVPFSKAPFKIGVSLKAYFGYKETLDWCRRVSQIAAIHPAVSRGLVSLFVLPSTPALGAVKPMLVGSKVGLGAQNLHFEDSGAYTGEVGGKFLKELGCEYAEIGHAERRMLFHESDEDVALKVAAAFRNKLTPILCVGEITHVTSAQAAKYVIKQIEDSISKTPESDSALKMVVAYEPLWAIGAEKPATAKHILEVSSLVQAFLSSHPRLAGSSLIYGGSAGPGLITELEGKIGGLFLGRLAHNPNNLIKILDEVVAVAEAAKAQPKIA